MADIQLSRPAANQTQTVTSAADARFVLNFAASEAKLAKSDNGENLILTFDDGAKIEVEGFYTAFNKDNLPTLNVGGQDITGEQLAAVLGADLMPAAGPAAQSAAQQGGRFRSYADADLNGGIDRLGGLDIGFDGAVQQDDSPENYYALADEPATALEEPGPEPTPAPTPITPTVSVENITEDTANLAYVVNFGHTATAGGTATVTIGGTDYTASFAAGATSVTVTVPNTFNTEDVYKEPDFTVNAKVNVTDGGFTQANPVDVTSTITDTITPVTLTLSHSAGGPVLTGADVTYTLTLNQALDEDLTVTLDGYATPVTISAGNTSATFDVTAVGTSLDVQITGATVPGKTFEQLDIYQPSLITVTVPGVLKLVDSNSVHAGETYDALHGTEAIAGGNVGRGAEDALTPLVIHSAEGVDTITIGGTLVVQGGALVVSDVMTPHGKLIVKGFAPMPDGAQLTYTFQPFDSSVGSEPDIAVTVTDKLGQSCAGTIRLNIFDAPVPPDQNGNPVTIHPAAITPPNVGEVPAADWQSVGPSGHLDDHKFYTFIDKDDTHTFDSYNYEGGLWDTKLESKRMDALAGDDTITIKSERLTELTNTSVQGGNGNDSISIKSEITANLVNSAVDGGADNDHIEIGYRTPYVTLEKTLVTGGTGNDTISIDSEGGGNNKTIIKDTRVDGGGDDDDTIEIGLKSSTTSLEGSVVAGGGGTDNISIDARSEISLINTRVDGGDGENTITIGAAHNAPTATLKNTVISGGKNTDTIKIESQTDLKLTDVNVSADDGTNFITIGGGQNDTVTLTRVSVSGGKDQDNISLGDIRSGTVTLEDVSVAGDAEDDNISIGHAGDSVTLTNVVVNGGSDNDNIYVSHNVYNSKDDFAANFTSLKNTTLRGDYGDDDIRVGGGETTFENVAVDGGEDKDQISITGLKQRLSNATISGGGGNDSIIIGDTRAPQPLRNSVTLDGTTVYGGEDKDFIFIHRYDGAVSLENSAAVSGDAGDDTLFIGYSGDGGHTDVYTALSKVYGDSAWARTYTTKEVVLDQATVFGGTGNDAIMIGDGKRSFDFDGTGTSLKGAAVYGGEGNDTIQITGKTLTMKDASVEGETGADNISITGGTATLDNVTVNGGEDNDTLYVSGTVQNSLVDGGYGNDAITVGGTLGNVTVDGGAGADAITVTGKMLEGVEIFGGMGDDTLDADGTTGGARLFGGTGNDKLTGGTGDDYLHGGSGVDEISGGEGNDLIVYDIMDKSIDGGAGIDFVLSEDSDLTMDKLLNGWSEGPVSGPHANNVEVLIKGDAALKLTSIEQMATDYGINVVAGGIVLEHSKWTEQTGESYTTYTYNDDDLTLIANTITVQTTGS